MSGRRRAAHGKEHGWIAVSIMHAPYNPYHAEAFGLVLKLSYAAEGREKPRLEIVPDDEDARAREWAIYGPLLESDDPRLAEVRFSGTGEERAFRIGDGDYLIRFEAVGEAMERFADGMSEMMPVYSFRLRVAG